MLISQRDNIQNRRVYDTESYVCRCAMDAITNLLGSKYNISFAISDLENPTAENIKFQFVLDRLWNKVYIEWMANKRLTNIFDTTYVPNKITGSEVFDQYLSDMIKTNLELNTSYWPELILPDDDGTVTYAQDSLSLYSIGVFYSFNQRYYTISNKEKINNYLLIHYKQGDYNRADLYNRVVKINNKYKNSNKDLPKAFNEYKSAYAEITGIKLNEIEIDQAYLNVILEEK